MYTGLNLVVYLPGKRYTGLKFDGGLGTLTHPFFCGETGLIPTTINRKFAHSAMFMG
jgi:hypothetical protein